MGTKAPDGIEINSASVNAGENRIFNLKGDKGNRHSYSFRDPELSIVSCVLNAGPYPIEIEYSVHDQSDNITMTVASESEGAAVSNAWACKVGPTELDEKFRAIGWVVVKSTSAKGSII